MRYRAVVEYDGTAYCGFQRQATHPSIQQWIEKAIKQVAQFDTTILAAGRTDAGVHAKGQVIAFDLEWQHSPEELFRAINSNLPDDIALLKLSRVGSGFHPRFQAKSRLYHYYIYNDPVRSPLQRLYSWQVTRRLDVSLMNKASATLVGTHDFATFGKSPTGINTVRQVFAAGWDEKRNLLTFAIEANAFLYRMVRSITGSLKMVGEGSWSVEEFVDAFNARDRSRAAQVAPSRGVCLMAVRYD